MSEERIERRKEERIREKKMRTSIWVGIGAVLLILLLIIWLTVADMSGDTDVAAQLLG
ncbi:MAG: hypothetical protein K2M76_07980 [Muribaculaceae bacterium]|nr:hypothetical protein [Muribaculaceae bacterium]